MCVRVSVCARARPLTPRTAVVVRGDPAVESAGRMWHGALDAAPAFLLACVCCLHIGTSGQRCQPSFTIVKGQRVCSQQVIFEENFDSNLDRNKWKHTVRISGPEEQEFVIYDKRPENSYTRGGILYLKPILLEDSVVDSGTINLDGCTGAEGSDECYWQSSSFSIMPPIRSAEIKTMPFTFRYGKVEVRAKLPIGDWIVPHIYIKSQFELFGQFNASARATLVKAHGNNDLFQGTKDLGRKLAVQSVNASFGRQSGSATVNWDNSQGWDEDFHTYSLIWTPESLSFGVDDLERHTLIILNNTNKMFKFVDNKAPSEKGTSLPPFEQEFYIAMGVSVGGMTEFPDNVLNYGKAKPWSNLRFVKARLNFWKDHDAWHPTWDGENSALQIDSVKVTAL